MPVRPIAVYDDPVLRKKSRRVRHVGPAIRALVDDMIETMHAADGIGLAAIQIGVPESVIVAQLREDENNPDGGRLYVVVNPQLVRKSREMEVGTEGCLSVPGLAGEVPRHRAVTVKGWDVHRKPVRIKAEGLLARVFQHEIDHCNGILFIDHITDPAKLWTVKEEAAEAAQQGKAAGPIV